MGVQDRTTQPYYNSGTKREAYGEHKSSYLPRGHYTKQIQANNKLRSTNTLNNPIGTMQNETNDDSTKRKQTIDIQIGKEGIGCLLREIRIIFN